MGSVVSTADPPWLVRLATCPSTNTWALERAATLAHGTAIWALQQTAGRGRDGRHWLAPPGTLTASVILDCPGDARPLALAAGLAVAHAAEDLAPAVAVTVKWPNDCRIGGRKLAGILCERSGSGALVVGVGCNLAPRWEALGPEGAALRSRCASLDDHGPAPDPLAFLTALRRYLLEAAGLVAAGRFTVLLPELRRRDALLGRRLAVVDGPRRETGTGAGIDDQGRLLVRRGSAVTAIASGSIEELPDSDE